MKKIVAVAFLVLVILGVGIYMEMKPGIGGGAIAGNYPSDQQSLMDQYKKLTAMNVYGANSPGYRSLQVSLILSEKYALGSIHIVKKGLGIFNSWCAKVEYENGMTPREALDASMRERVGRQGYDTMTPMFSETTDSDGTKLLRTDFFDSDQKIAASLWIDEASGIWRKTVDYDKRGIIVRYDADFKVEPNLDSSNTPYNTSHASQNAEQHVENFSDLNGQSDVAKLDDYFRKLIDQDPSLEDDSPCQGS